MYVFRGDINAYFYQKNKIKAVSRLFLLLEKGVASLKAFFFHCTLASIGRRKLTSLYISGPCHSHRLEADKILYNYDKNGLRNAFRIIAEGPMSL